MSKYETWEIQNDALPFDLYFHSIHVLLEYENLESVTKIFYLVF